MKERVVLDKNVVLSAFKSKNGAPYELLRRLAEDQFEITISVPLIMEYEEILKAKNQFVNSAIAEKVTALETENYIKLRGELGISCLLRSFR